MKTSDLKRAAGISLLVLAFNYSYAAKQNPEAQTAPALKSNTGILTGRMSDDEPKTVSIPVNESMNGKITFYPNPAKDKAVLKIENLNATGTYKVIIYDALGKKVQENPVSSEETSLSLNSLNPGLYFYTINVNNKQQATGKFLVN